MVSKDILIYKDDNCNLYVCIETKSKRLLYIKKTYGNSKEMVVISKSGNIATGLVVDNSGNLVLSESENQDKCLRLFSQIEKELRKWCQTSQVFILSANDPIQITASFSGDNHIWGGN